MRTSRTLLAAAIAVALTACASTETRVPEVELPPEWRVNLDDTLLDRLREWLAPENVQVLY